MQLNPYLNFNGNCEEALKFYEKALPAKIVVSMTYGGSPMAKQMPPEVHNKIMHARLDVKGQTIMASDAMCDHYEKPTGFNITLNTDDPAEAERLFKALSEKGNICMKLEETFWAQRFGMLVDQFGIPWMINCEKKN
ncbi:MAG TPA: VOC family protein [Candidatus Methylacidiphilales bacterium]|nr:VOC family protein [Candidatus Methylacidiphilales bacterium]